MTEMNSEDTPEDLRPLVDRLTNWLGQARDRATQGDPSRLFNLLKDSGPFELFSAQLVDTGIGVPIRSVATSADPLVLTTDWVEVIVDLVPAADGHVKLRGQVTGAAEPCSVQLVQGVEEIGLTVADEWGEFSFAPVSPGAYELYVTSDTREFVAALTVE